MISLFYLFYFRTLEARYPCFTTENALLQALLSNASIGDHIASSEHLLAQLALLRHQLELGGLLLPDLVELYQWIHQELSHVVTRSDAETIPLSRAVQVLAKSYSPEEGERLHNLYKKLRGTFILVLVTNNSNCSDFVAIVFIYNNFLHEFTVYYFVC